MKNRLLCILLLLMGQLFWTLPAKASQEEIKLLAVFFGRFASYIELPAHTTGQYVITLLDDNPFGGLLDELYRGKMIGGKPVVVRYATTLEQVGQTDILFITLVNPRSRQEAIDYAQKNAILSISNATGFADRGGIIQVDFVQQQTRIKINHGAAVKSNIRIGAPLLSLATVIRGEAP